jgi:hypothetical protein
MGFDWLGRCMIKSESESESVFVSLARRMGAKSRQPQWLVGWPPAPGIHSSHCFSSHSSFLLLQQCAHKTTMSSNINRMKIESLLDHCHQSGLSNSRSGHHLAPSSNAPVLPLSPVKLNSGPIKTPVCLQDVSFQRRLA